MKPTIRIELNTEPLEKNKRIVRDGLHTFNVNKIGTEKELAFFAFNETSLIGGAICLVEKQSIFIDNLWVEEKYRHQGIGSQLLNRAETAAREHGVMYSTTDTYEFQAVEFYRKSGYQELGIIKDYLEGYDRYFFRKNLTPTP